MLKGFNLPQGALRFRRTLGCSQIVYRLQVQPELRGAAEVVREPHGGIGGNRAAAVQNVGDAARRDADVGRPRDYERLSALHRSWPDTRMAAQNDIQEIKQGVGEPC